ncbi:MAG: site-specific integrase, partial [Candidatus Bathyarchaeota archaeon]|nr:site-specific integrase [Candidatus Bathyarchaeota archaeon]
EIDDLIARCSKQMATYLQTLKETAARRGEAFDLKWTDIDPVTWTIRITPEKGSNPRIFRISTKLAQMLSSLPRSAESQKIWIYKNKFYLDKQFRRQRKRAAQKLGNPRILKIHFHTLRHWKATTLYHQTKDILFVMQFLGHKKIENTLKYIQLQQALYGHLAEEYICKVAKSLKEATELIEAGFEYVTDMVGCKLFRKLKTSYLGSSTSKMGSSASLV